MMQVLDHTGGCPRCRGCFGRLASHACDVHVFIELRGRRERRVLEL